MSSMLRSDDADIGGSIPGFAPVDFFFRQELTCFYNKKGLHAKHQLPELCTFLGEGPLPQFLWAGTRQAFFGLLSGR